MISAALSYEWPRAGQLGSLLGTSENRQSVMQACSAAERHCKVAGALYSGPGCRQPPPSPPMNWPRTGTVVAQPAPALTTARPPTATITVRFGLCGAPRRGQRAGRAGGEGGGGATDQRLPDMLLYHGQRRAPGAELGSRHGDQRRVESCSGLIGEPGGAGRAWRGAGRAGVWRPGRRAPHAPCTR